MLQAVSTSASHELAIALEQFITKAEAFLTNHYLAGSDLADLEAMLVCIENLKLDIDVEALKAEFERVQERKDLLADYSEHYWVA